VSTKRYLNIELLKDRQMRDAIRVSEGGRRSANRKITVGTLMRVPPHRAAPFRHSAPTSGD